MAWQPSPESLQTLAVYLKDSLSGFDKSAQKKAELVSRLFLLRLGLSLSLSRRDSPGEDQPC